MDIQDREEAVAILTREDSTNVSLLLARPEIEVRKLDMRSSGSMLNTDLKNAFFSCYLPLCVARNWFTLDHSGNTLY